MYTSFQGLNITSAMFLTSMAANPLPLSWLEPRHNVDLGYLGWSCGSSWVAQSVLIPYMIYKLYPPEFKETPDAVRMAKMKLEKMGKMAVCEWIMLEHSSYCSFCGSSVRNQSTQHVGCLAGLGILLVTKVLTWDDVLGIIVPGIHLFGLQQW
ncbi:MAG: hypothetical protein CM1200mP3_10130 [Chloroflexota bacterium]|nr:MAG: hypothetical protein CM1200mP3_10130 [Chloroflexota bacterium]